MMKNERNISSSSSSDTIKHHLNNVHNIAKAGLDNSSIFTSLSETTRELLLYKEKCVNLQTQLTISNETLSLQAAEFSFQKREYELEIEQLKKIEENLRSQIYKFTTNLSDNDALINLKNEINLYKMKNDELQKKHLKWKKKAKLLLDQSSMEHSKSNDYNVLHSKYIKWKNKAKSFQSSAHENTTQSNLESNNHNNSSKVENLGTIKSHHNSFNLEIEKHHETLPESTFDSKKISFNESKICNLEEEIKKLKEENEDSLKELKNSNKKIEKIEKKYKKWKKRAKNQDFNSSQKNENIVNIEMKYSQLEKELIDQKESNKKLNQALFDNKKVHLEEKHKLESKYIKWKNKNKNSLGKNSQKVEKIKKQYKIIDSKYKKWKGKFKELKSENTKLQEKIGKEKERLKLLVEKYKKLHSRYQILHSQQNSIQNEISNSHNMNNNNNQDNSNNQDSNNNEIDDNSLKNIQKKSDSNDKNICGNEEADSQKEEKIVKDWKQLANKCRMLMQKVSVLEESNENLANQLNCDPKTGEVHKNTKTIENIAFHLIKSKLSLIIDKQNNKITNLITNLHDSLIPNQSTNFRSIILMLIFIKGFKKAKSFPFDPQSLLIFYGRPEYSIEKKIYDIYQKFTELTQDFLVSKQNCADIQNEKLELINQINQTKMQDFNTNQLNQKLVCYKARILELQEFLSTMVSPEQYQEVRIHADRLEQENMKMKEKYDSMKKEVDEFTEKSISLERQIEDLKIRADVKSNEAHISRSQYAEKENEIHTLKAIIHDKTKEILALERLVNKQENSNEAKTKDLALLTVENMIMRQFQANSTAKHERTTHNSKINPAFLGK